MLSTRVIENYTTSMITSLKPTAYIFRSIIRFRRANCFCDETRKPCVVWICGNDKGKGKEIKILRRYLRGTFLHLADVSTILPIEISGFDDTREYDGD